MTDSGDGWRLRRAGEGDLKVVMGWFKSQNDVELWGGPNFRFPFDGESFREDAHFDDMDTFVIGDEDERTGAFGQIYNRNDHINLARLVVDPGRRGQGLGRRLVSGLLEVGPSLFSLDLYSLFVYKHNVPALELYRSMGFSIQKYPKDQILADECWFLTRPLDSAC